MTSGAVAAPQSGFRGVGRTTHHLPSEAPMKCLPTVLALLVLLPVSLFGQDSTAKGNATPFHQGQWAAQFQAGTAFGSLGFIKFRSPTRALVLDLHISGSHSETVVTDSSGTRFGDL